MLGFKKRGKPLVEKQKSKGLKDETSLLPLIEEKEKFLEQMLEDTKQRVEQEVEAAKAKAKIYIKEAKEGLPELARQRFESGLKSTREEVRKIEENGQKEIEELNRKAEQSMKKAREEVLDISLPELRSR